MSQGHTRKCGVPHLERDARDGITYCGRHVKGPHWTCRRHPDATPLICKLCWKACSKVTGQYVSGLVERNAEGHWVVRISMRATMTNGSAQNISWNSGNTSSTFTYYMRWNAA